VYDAVNAITGGHEPYLGAPSAADENDSVNAAATEAAYRVLVGVVPSPSAQLATDYTNAITAITAEDGSAATTGGVEVGLAAANAMLAARSGDNRTSPTAFTVGSEIRDWQPLAAGTAGNNFRWVGNLDPFLIPDADMFATAGPLDLSSAAYAAEFNQVKSLGRATGSTRTQDQTQMALFWADNAAAMWTRIFQQLAGTQQLSVDDSARYFAMLYLTSEDAIIACFDDKERYHFWRPTTAIHDAEHDGNPATADEDGWTALVGVPPYPDHPSGHTCVSNSIVQTLKDFFGTNRMSFFAVSAGGIRRDFSRFSQAIAEIRLARVYGGLHFMTADAQGASLGRRVADWRQDHYFQPID
jgi:hypothetical protein